MDHEHGHPTGRGPLRAVVTDSPEMFAWIAMGAMKYATSDGVLPKFLDWLSEGQDQIDAGLSAIVRGMMTSVEEADSVMSVAATIMQAGLSSMGVPIKVPVVDTRGMGDDEIKDLIEGLNESGYGVHLLSVDEPPVDPEKG